MVDKSGAGQIRQILITGAGSLRGEQINGATGFPEDLICL